jgi:hypothetical protein
VLTVRALLDDLELDFTNEAAWGYRPDPTRADRVEIVAFSAYFSAIAARFGDKPLDPLGRPAVAATFDPANAAHVRAVLKELLSCYPTKRLFELEPGIVPDFVSDPTTAQQTRVDAAIERQFGSLLDNVTEGLVLTQKALVRRVVEPAELSNLAPALGTQLLVPSVAGLKRLFIEDLAAALVREGWMPRDEFLATYNPLFYQPKPVESASQPTTGLVGLSVAGGATAGSSLVTLEAGDELVRLQLDYKDALGPLLAPDYGLAVRYRLGGTARAGIDYEMVGDGGIPIASIHAGESTGTLSLRVMSAALAAGDRFIQIELLSADSGMRVDGTRAVVTIALGAKALPPGSEPTGDRASFMPHQLVTASDAGPAVIRAPAGGSHVILRGEHGRADLFVVGDTQSAGIPFIENFRAEDGDRIWIAAGDLVAHRRANLLADSSQRASALHALQTRYGVAAIAGLSGSVLDDLVAAEIEAAGLGPFVITELNTYGGFIFDVTGRKPVAMASDYSPVTGDNAWASLSMNPAAGTAFATVLTLSARTVAENVAADAVVGTLATFEPGAAGPFTHTLASGAGDDDNADFAIENGQLRTRRPFNFESEPLRSIRVRSTDAAGNAFEQAFTVRVTDVNERPTAAWLSGGTVIENAAIGTVVGTLAATDPDLGDRPTFSLVSGSGATDNASFTIVGNELRTATGIDFEAGATRSVRIRTTDSGGRSKDTVMSISVTNVKEAPTIMLPAGGFHVVEDTRGPLAFAAPPFGTSDALPTKRITVTLAVPRGAIKAVSAAGVIVGGTPTAVTFFGTIADLNRFFTDSSGLIVYRPRANDTAPVTLAVTVVENTLKGAMRSTATATITIASVNDLPVVNFPTEFTVIEDVRGALSWDAIDLPFADIESPTLTVTLSVDEGTLDAASDGGVTVGGTATARSFAGTTSALNAFFRSLGRIGYTTATDNTVARALRTTVSDGQDSVTVTSRIRIIAVQDAPTINAETLFTGAVAGKPFAITHAMLVSASGARDAENSPLTFRVLSLQTGRIEKWNGRFWVPLIAGDQPQPAELFGAVLPSPVIRPGERIRWVPSAAASGLTPAFTIRVNDGQLASLTSRVSIAVGSPRVSS